MDFSYSMYYYKVKASEKSGAFDFHGIEPTKLKNEDILQDAGKDKR